MNPISNLAGLFLLSTILVGCSGMLSSKQPAKQVYLLHPITLGANTGDVGQDPPTLALSLIAAPGLDTDRIQAVNADARIIPYANARWPDFLPEVLTSTIRRSLWSGGRFANITTGVASPSTDWSLELEAQRFFGVQDVPGNTSRVSAEFDATLNCGGNSYRLNLSSSRPVGEERLSVVVRAHQEALDDVTRQLWAQLQSRCD